MTCRPVLDGAPSRSKRDCRKGVDKGKVHEVLTRMKDVEEEFDIDSAGRQHVFLRSHCPIPASVS